jgi:hypothetical protein
MEEVVEGNKTQNKSFGTVNKLTLYYVSDN